MRLVFCDFDRTQVAHMFPSKYSLTTDKYETSVYLWRHADERIAEDIYVPQVRQYLEECYSKGDKVFSLTHTSGSFEDDYKKKSLMLNGMSWMEYVSVSKRESKVPLILAIAKELGVAPKDCVIIDDMMETVYEANSAGIQAMSLSDILVLKEGK